MADRRVTELEERISVLELTLRELITRIEEMENVYDVGGVVLEGAPTYVKKFTPPSGDKN
jgi:hypothetical protein